MHRVRAWAHSSAHKNHFNPWAQDLESSAGTPEPATEEASQSSQANSNISLLSRILKNSKTALFHSWVNLLLVFVPAGIIVHFAEVNSNVVFALNAVAIIPLAGLLTFATESVAHRLGPTLGALLNVSFGNAVELIIFIIALVKNEIRIVQASLIGSLLANLLLILGMAFLIGGLEFQEQIYDSTVTQMSACLLALSVLSLLIPTVFHASFSDLALADAQVLKLSRGTSVILLLIYVLYLLFQLKSHAYLYVGTPQHRIDETTVPGFLARFDSTSSSSVVSSHASTSGSATNSGSNRRVRKRLKSKLGRKRHVKTEVVPGPATDKIANPNNPDSGDIITEKPSDAPDEHPHSQHTSKDHSTAQSNPDTQQKPLTQRGISFRPPPVFRSATTPSDGTRDRASPLQQSRSDPGNRNPARSTPAHHIRRQDSPKGPVKVESEPPMSQTASIMLLLISTGLVALCAEFLVGSIQHLVENSPLSEAFIGLIILPIVGNAAEHVTAITVAAKNKLDLALGVALGSSIQIALFVTPFVVILGWILDKDMSLYFSLFETGALFVSTFIVNFLVLDGRSNYLEGALLCACYIVIAVGAYFFPDGQDQSSVTSGPSN
ncbi:hypothetical protein B0A52_03753 [Exophiala mesophila]|uniref:Sodium/calcium exchanger membrane region domain-containing protein n=1 Tax=Exophiala mesophila TaxID=212818 RepID=A0A438NAA3_EXOME|nr:hypothetical protein B0A52_03753 [Exophiala mesophila]